MCYYVLYSLRLRPMNVDHVEMSLFASLVSVHPSNDPPPPTLSPLTITHQIHIS